MQLKKEEYGEKKYENLYPIIQEFFSQRQKETDTGFADFSVNVCLSPYGGRNGPDILSIALVAEIKDKEEIKRDLRNYWNQWNNENLKFGGKEKGFKLSGRFSDKKYLEKLDNITKGWIATVYGQLKYYAEVANLKDGWLIVEKSKDIEDEVSKIESSLKFLEKEEKIIEYHLHTYKDLKFYHIIYNHDKNNPDKTTENET